MTKRSGVIAPRSPGLSNFDEESRYAMSAAAAGPRGVDVNFLLIRQSFNNLERAGSYRASSLARQSNPRNRRSPAQLSPPRPALFSVSRSRNFGNQMALSVGDVVRLKTGGPEMTVESTAQKGADVLCTWLAEGVAQRSHFKALTLRRVEATPPKLTFPIPKETKEGCSREPSRAQLRYGRRRRGSAAVHAKPLLSRAT